MYYAASDDSINSINLINLVADIRKIVFNAESLQSVYEEISDWYPDYYQTLTVDEISEDLYMLKQYQHIRDELPMLEEEAKVKIGEEYKGVSTNWKSVYSNIEFCDNVISLLSKNIDSKLITAFVNGTALYSKLQLSELQKFQTAAKKLESQYSVLYQCKDISKKVEILSDVIGVLNSLIKFKDNIVAVAYVECTYQSIVEDLHTLVELQGVQELFNTEIINAKKILPIFTFDDNTDWDYIIEIFNHLKQVRRMIGTGSIDPEITRFVTNGISGVKPISYYDLIDKVLSSKNIVTDITNLFENKTMLESYNLSKLIRRFKNCNEQFSTMDTWIDLRDCRKACIDKGLEDFVVKAEDTYYPEGKLKDVFLKSFYYEWFEKICTEIESVSTFRVRSQESRVEAFCELDSYQLPIAQMRIREKLISEMPSKHSFGRATDEMSILLHEITKKRKIMPLRKLFRTIPNLLLKLKPCLMMSPLSVSYFLEAETYRFDLVIFDEASQIFPQDAIGAIFRAKQVIITGDSKQLPPTNFFSASTSNEVDFDTEEEEEEFDFDSILEEASNSLPNRSLLWHYRSRFEELISFSNQQIYQNNLITFPSSSVKVPDTGVEYVYVKNGVYDNRCNRAEAQEIVRLVVDHIRNHQDCSLGIIAFSESQQSVIEDELNKFRIKNPKYEKFFDEDKEEPFFIKNLENVQGDERDTIIFSICYAKNSQGRMYMRFGPLGHQGGERRLNVAITRAKRNIKLVGSIWPEDIDLSKTRSEGVKMLRSYILFAMRGSDVLVKEAKKNSLYEVDTFSEQIGDFLSSHGCIVKRNVGSSDYTIDIAVEHPKKPGRYIAGIECDGSSYYMARTVRDREHLRTAVLKQMGWKMYRVWSTEWIRNPDAEKERLIKFVQDALLSYQELTSDDKLVGSINNFVGTEVVKSDNTLNIHDNSNPYNLPLYEEGNWRKRTTSRGNDNLSRIADMVNAVVMVEQPMHMELLYKRVGQGFITGKATQSIKDTIDLAIRERMQGEVVIDDQFICLSSFTAVKVRRSELGDPDRNIEHISILEIAAAMEKILVGAYGIERNVLCLETARIFGFERTGPKIKQRTNEALNYLIRTKMVSCYDDKIQLI